MSKTTDGVDQGTAQCRQQQQGVSAKAAENYARVCRPLAEKPHCQSGGAEEEFRIRATWKLGHSGHPAAGNGLVIASLQSRFPFRRNRTRPRFMRTLHRTPALQDKGFALGAVSPSFTRCARKTWEIPLRASSFRRRSLPMQRFRIEAAMVRSQQNGKEPIHA